MQHKPLHQHQQQHHQQQRLDAAKEEKILRDLKNGGCRQYAFALTKSSSTDPNLWRIVAAAIRHRHGGGDGIILASAISHFVPGFLSLWAQCEFIDDHKATDDELKQLSRWPEHGADFQSDVFHSIFDRVSPQTWDVGQFVSIAKISFLDCLAHRFESLRYACQALPMSKKKLMTMVQDGSIQPKHLHRDIWPQLAQTEIRLTLIDLFAHRDFVPLFDALMTLSPGFLQLPLPFTTHIVHAARESAWSEHQGFGRLLMPAYKAKIEAAIAESKARYLKCMPHDWPRALAGLVVGLLF